MVSHRKNLLRYLAVYTHGLLSHELRSLALLQVQAFNKTINLHFHCHHHHADADTMITILTNSTSIYANYSLAIYLLPKVTTTRSSLDDPSNSKSQFSEILLLLYLIAIFKRNSYSNSNPKESHRRSDEAIL